MPDNNPFLERHNPSHHAPTWMQRWLPSRLKKMLIGAYWKAKDLQDFAAEATGWLPSHTLRLACYRWLLGVQIGENTSIHRNCRMYYPSGISILAHTVINRDVLLDGRMGLRIGSNVSISEGVFIFTLEHDPASPTFAEKGGQVIIEDNVFVGARASILPGVTVHTGSVIAAGAVVTRNVPPFTIVGGIPARPIGSRPQDLQYNLSYRKFLG